MKYIISSLIAVTIGITVGWLNNSIALGAIIAALCSVSGNLICNVAKTKT